jgi:hypothetical protein
MPDEGPTWTLAAAKTCMAFLHQSPIEPSLARIEGSLWAPADVAASLRVSRSWVYQKAEAGLLPVIRMPGSALLRFDPETMRAYARGEWRPPKNPVVPSSRVRPKQSRAE